MDCIKKKEVIGRVDIVILDIRTAEERNKEAITGSLHIPLDELSDRLDELSMSKQYVTACQKGGGRSVRAAELLNKVGFQAGWLCGGTSAWLID